MKTPEEIRAIILKNWEKLTGDKDPQVSKFVWGPRDIEQGKKKKT